MVPIYKGGDRSVVSNYRPISLTSLVCKQLEHVIAGYLRQVWHKNDGLYDGQRGFRPGYSCESQSSRCARTHQTLGRGGRYRCDYKRLFQGFRFSSSRSAAYETGSLRRGFEGSHLSKGIPCRSYTKGKSRRATIQEVKVTSGVSQGSVLGPLWFLVYINNIWRNINSSIRLFTVDCIIYRKITNKNDTENLHKDLDTLGEWEAENGMKINPSKSKRIRFTKAWVKNPLGYSLGDQKIP